MPASLCTQMSHEVRKWVFIQISLRYTVAEIPIPFISG